PLSPQGERDVLAPRERGEGFGVLRRGWWVAAGQVWSAWNVPHLGRRFAATISSPRGRGGGRSAATTCREQDAGEGEEPGARRGDGPENEELGGLADDVDGAVGVDGDALGVAGERREVELAE